MNKIVDDSIFVAIHCIAYNHESFIRECLEGFVIQKTNFKFIAIVHDDASTDNTTTIICEYALKYPDIIEPIFETENQYSKHDGSLDRIMETALKTTGAKYIAVCEGDDYWTDPYKLQKQVDYMESHPDCSLCFHKAEVVSENSAPINIFCEKLEERDYSPEEVLANWIVPTASLLFKRECLDYKLVDREKFVYGDIVYILRGAAIGKMHCMSDNMSVYRVHANGAISNKKIQHSALMNYVEHNKCIKKNFPFVKSNVVNWRISSGYYYRASFPTSIIGCAHDLFLSFCYSPKAFFNGVKKTVKKHVFKNQGRNEFRDIK